MRLLDRRRALMAQVRDGLVNAVYTSTQHGTITVTQNRIVNLNGITNNGINEPVIRLIRSIPVSTSIAITVTSNKNHSRYWAMTAYWEDNYYNQNSINGLTADTPKTIRFNASNHGKLIGLQIGCAAGWDDVSLSISLEVDGKTIF